MLIRPGVRRLFRLALHRPDLVERDVDAEIRLHLELRTERLVRAGLSPNEARREALRRFGPVDRARRTLRKSASRRDTTMRVREWIDGLRQDARYAARTLLRERMFAAFVVATLGLGIGANATMFGIVDRLLLRGPEHVRDPERVTRFYVTETPPGMGEFTGSTVGYVTYASLRQRAHSFDGVAGYAVNDAIAGHGRDARSIRAGYATWDFFPLLGVHPQLGRFFGEDDDRASGAEHVVVLSSGLWQRAYGSDRSAVGRTLTIGDEPYTIIGVAPKGFTGAELARVDLWIPMSIFAARMGDDWATTWSSQWMQVIGRLKPGVTREQASADATAAYRQSYVGTDRTTREGRLSVAPLSFNGHAKESAETAISRWLLGVAVIVLLIACSNVGNLLLARATARRREVAVRLALGAGRGRLIRLLFVEGMLLAIAGGGAGLVIAQWSGQFARVVLLPDVEWTTSPVDVRVLVFAAAVALATGVLIALVPALQASRPDLTVALKAGGSEGSTRGSTLRGALTVAQAALSVVLLVGAGLFVRSLANVRALDLGMQPDRVLAVSVSWPRVSEHVSEAELNGERVRRKEFFARAVEQVRHLPGVEHASLALGLPFQSSYGIPLRVPGRDSLPRLKGGSPRITPVAGDYFATVGTPVLRGRAFTAADRAGGEHVTIVSATMARTLWPAQDAIGKCLIIGADTMPCSRVVGVVADTRRFRLREEPSIHCYVPLGQSGFLERTLLGQTLLVRPRGDPATMIAPVRRLLLATDPAIVYVDAQPLQQAIDPQVRPWRLGATVFSAFGFLALAVAAVGLYSVISYVVAQRTREIGVRIALGARSSDILGLIVRQGIGTAALGIAIGIVLALVAGRSIEPLLFETSPRNPVVIGIVAIVLLLVAAVASLVPALRAKHIDPMVALRAD